MLIRIVLVLLILLLAMVLVLPFILNIFGFTTLQFGAAGGDKSAARLNPALLRSLNGGLDWEDSSVVENPKAAFPARLLALAFHPTDANFMLLGTKGAGLWKTKNGGAFWKKVEDKNELILVNADIQKISFSESEPQILYVAAFQGKRGRLFKSMDGGESFSESYFVTADGYTINDFYVHHKNPDLVILATGQGGVLESRNGGKTWRVVRWFSGAVETLLVNPLDVKEMVVQVSRNSVFKTIDGGQNWTDLSGAIRTSSVIQPQVPMGTFNPFVGLGVGSSLQVLVADPSHFSTLYVGSSEGLTRSKDGGFLWTRLNVLLPPEALPITSIAINPRAGETIFIGAGAQLHRSDDGGINWNVQIIPTESKVKSLQLHPLQPQILFAILGK